MIVENIKKKQNVNTSSNDSAADEDDIMTGQELTSLSGKVRKEVDVLLNYIFSTKEEYSERYKEVPFTYVGSIEKFWDLAHAYDGKPEMLKQLILYYAERCTDIKTALERAKEVYNQKLEREDLDGREPGDTITIDGFEPEL